MHKSAQDDGFSLLVVLALLLIVSMVLSETTRLVRYQQSLVNYQLERSRAEVLFDQSVIYIENIFNAQRASNYFALNQWYSCDLEEGYSTFFRIIDHDGLIDINVASRQWLIVGFEALGLKKEKAENLADLAIDYRDRDFTNSQGNPEALVFSEPHKAFSFGPRNAPFPSFVFLDQLPNFSVSKHPEVSEVFTTQSGLDGIDPNVSSATRLRRIVGRSTRKSRQKILSLDIHIARGGITRLYRRQDLVNKNGALDLVRNLESHFLSAVPPNVSFKENFETLSGCNLDVEIA